MVQVSSQKSKAGRELVKCTRRMNGYNRPPKSKCKVAGRGLQNKTRRRGAAASNYRVAVRKRTTGAKRKAAPKKKTATRRTSTAPVRRSARTTAGTRGFYEPASGGTLQRRAKRS